MSDLAADPNSNRLSHWAVDVVVAIVLALALTVLAFVGIFAYAVGHSHSMRIPGFIEVVVDARGGFTASSGAYLPLVYLALAALVLIVTRAVRRARRRGGARP